MNFRNACDGLGERSGVSEMMPLSTVPKAFVQTLWLIVLPGAIASMPGSYIGYLISLCGGDCFNNRDGRNRVALGCLYRRFEKPS